MSLESSLYSCLLTESALKIENQLILKAFLGVICQLIKMVDLYTGWCESRWTVCLADCSADVDTSSIFFGTKYT